VFGLITVPLINSLPPLYFEIYRTFHLSPPVFFVAQFLLCAGIMLVPTTLMGATFPVVSKKVTEAMEVMGRGVGGAYSFNTSGAIIGSFSAGFLLIPVLGVRAATITAAVLNIVVAVGMIGLSRARVKGALIAAFLVVFAAPLVGALVSEGDEWPVNYYMAERVMSYEDFAKDQAGADVLFKGDYREGPVKAWRSRTGALILQVGGKIEGTDISEFYTILASYLPVASHPEPGSMLVIGMGAGVTPAAAKGNVEELHVVEINEGVVEAVRRFGQPGLLDGINVAVNDGRNYLLLAERKFDIITSTPSFPTEASAANLFTMEFYELAASRLNPGGVYCQWLPYYLLSNDDITMMLRTFGSVFEHTYLWKSEDSLDLLMVGSNAAFRFGHEEIMERARGIRKRDNLPFTFYGDRIPVVLSRTPEQVRDIVRNRTEIPINTDDRPILEFHAARNLLLGRRALR
jgi:spermidine synthase